MKTDGETEGREPTQRALSKERGREEKIDNRDLSNSSLKADGGRRVQNYKRAYRIWRTGKERKRAETFQQISGGERERMCERERERDVI